MLLHIKRIRKYLCAGPVKGLPVYGSVCVTRLRQSINEKHNRFQRDPFFCFRLL